MENKNYYILPNMLSAALVESQCNNICTDELAVMILKINKAVLNFPRFRFLPREVKEEIESYSNERLLKKGIYSADPTNPRLFSYFTTAISLNMLQRKMWLTKKAELKRNFEAQMYKDLGLDYLEYDTLYEDYD